MELSNIEIPRDVLKHIKAISGWKQQRVLNQTCRFFKYVKTKEDRVYDLINSIDSNIIPFFKKIYQGKLPENGTKIQFWYSDRNKNHNMLFDIFKSLLSTKIYILPPTKYRSEPIFDLLSVPKGHLICIENKWKSVKLFYDLNSKEHILTRPLFRDAKYIVPNWYIVYISNELNVEFSISKVDPIFFRNQDVSMIQEDWFKEGLKAILES